jgi:hypothetical protein
VSPGPGGAGRDGARDRERDGAPDGARDRERDGARDRERDGAHDWERALARELAGGALSDEGVEAARNACVAGASIAAAAITAAAYYDNPLTGLGALRDCMRRLAATPPEPPALRAAFAPAPHPETLDPSYAPGFGFVPAGRAARVRAAAFRLLAAPPPGPRRAGPALLASYDDLTAVAGPLNAAGLAAFAFFDRAVDPERAERQFLLWRVEAALVEAQKARRAGLAAFPFLTEAYTYEGTRPPVRSFDEGALRARLGLD